MSLDDDADDDSLGFGQPLPPADRLWRHPSEIAAASRVAASWQWGPTLVAGLVGAVLATGVLTAVGGIRTRVEERAVVERVAVQPLVSSPLAGGDRGVVQVTDSMRPSIARLEVRTADDVVKGSGVIFRDNGYLLTSAHIVEDALLVHVVLADGRRYEADIVGTDPLTDAAVLKIDGKGLPTALLGSALDLEVGQPTVAIGAASGMNGDPSVTTGVISALGRRLDTGGEPLHGMIQTDAPVAPGCAGGALLDAAGAVIGITSAYADSSGDKLAFATPIDLARRVADDLISTGKVHHPWVGIEGTDLDVTTASHSGADAGALVRTVAAASPAAVAGLHADDVIVAIDGRRVETVSALLTVLRTHRPGEKVSLDYMRDGTRGTMVVTLAERPTQ